MGQLPELGPGEGAGSDAPRMTPLDLPATESGSPDSVTLEIAKRIRDVAPSYLGGLLIMRAEPNGCYVDSDQVKRNLARMLKVDPDLVVPALPAFPVREEAKYGGA